MHTSVYVSLLESIATSSYVHFAGRIPLEALQYVKLAHITTMGCAREVLICLTSLY